MKDIHQARAQWAAYIKSTSSFEALQAASLSDLNIDHGLGHSALRSLLWKSLLLCHKLDLATLLSAVRKERSAYEDHRTKYLRPLTSEQEHEQFAGADPLADDESSPWTSLRRDEQLRDEIQKDIDRTYPDNEFFRSTDVQVTLSNVLFIWSSLHRDVSYRQGMHELAAPVYWVIHADALSEQASTASTEDAAQDDDTMKELLDAAYIEHDTFAIFQKIMLFAKSWYETSHTDEKAVAGATAGSPIVRKSEYIHEGLLGTVDPELALHLDRMGILPQIFLIRWVRLMFGREFTFDQTLGLWDGIFAEDPTLQIVDYISVAMLLRIRWKLLESDYSTALTLLLRYEPSTVLPPLTLLKDAIHLRDDLTPATAARLIAQRTLRPPAAFHQPYTRISTPPPRAPGSNGGTSTSPRSPRLSAVTGLHLNNIETMMHDVASRMRVSSERWGVSQALREAMGEVKRVSAGVGEQQRDLLKRWTDSMERQTVLGAILEESIKVLEEEESGPLSPGRGEAEARRSHSRRDAIERVKYVRTCLLNSKTTLDRRWLTEVPDATVNEREQQQQQQQGSLPASPRGPTGAAPLPLPPPVTSKPPPFPTYLGVGEHAAIAPDTEAAAAAITPWDPPARVTATTASVAPSSLHDITPPPPPSKSSPTASAISKPLPTPRAQPQSQPLTPPAAAPKPRRSLAQTQFAWMLGGDDTSDKAQSSSSSPSAGAQKGNNSSSNSGKGGGDKRGGSRSDLFGGGGGLFGGS